MAGSTAAEGARRGCGDVSVMDHESVALAATPVHDLSPLSLCDTLVLGCHRVREMAGVLGPSWGRRGARRFSTLTMRDWPIE